MDIEQQRQGAVTVLKPKGPLVADDAEEFKIHLAEAFTSSLGRFVVDAAEIPFVDSRGLEVLVESAGELAQSGRAMKLCSVGGTLREVLELTGLDSLFEFHEDVNAGSRSFL
jgi:anti-anti-sigma factor